MSLYLARDDAGRGAPVAVCGTGEAMLRLAPKNCSVVAGVAPPEFNFDRSHYQWLALCLSACSESSILLHPLDTVLHGTHALTWASMHNIVLRAAVGGFDVPFPSDIANAVSCALIWSLVNKDKLHLLQPNDFELLPAMPRAAGEAWWRVIPLSSWVMDGLLQPLCHAIGFSGPFWDQRLGLWTLVSILAYRLLRS